MEQVYTRDTRAEDVNLRGALEKKHYNVDYYQREYVWGEKEVYELLDDLLIKFNESYNKGDIAKKVIEYKQYFLGSFVLSSKTGDDYIIDGQQRLTTLGLLFMYLYHRGQRDSIDIEESKNFVCSNNLGDIEFNINVKNRIPVMEYILNNQTETNVSDFIKNHKLVENYEVIKKYLDEAIDNDAIEVFYYWLSERVLMVRIVAYDDEEAYTIFESMNDRGKSLNNLDMLKGYLLSLIAKNDLEEMSIIWKKISSKFDEDEDFSKFLVSLFRAKWARTGFKNSKKDFGKNVKSDWSEINNHYHRFIKEHRMNDIVNIKSSSDVIKLLKDIDYYSDYHLTLKQYKNKLDSEYKEIYYLNKLNIPNLDLFFYALISPNDRDENIKTKIISKFLDIRSGMYSWYNLDTLSEANISDYFLKVIKRIRQLDDYEDYNTLIWFFYHELIIDEEKLKMKSKFGFPYLIRKNVIKRQVFYMLARFSSYLEDVNSENNFSNFYENNYEIEHILAKDYLVNEKWFDSEYKLNLVRDNIGALGLLPKKINASLNDMDYENKVIKYPQYNAFLGTLSKDLYKDNDTFDNRPGLNDIVKKHKNLKKSIKPYEKFNQKAVNERTDLCHELKNILWNINDISDFRDKDIFETMDDLNGYIDIGFPEEEYEEDDKEIVETYEIGSILYYEYNGTYLEGVFEGKSRITLTKVINGFYKESFSKASQRDFSYFKIVYNKIMKDVNSEKSRHTYNWTGSIEHCPIKMLINMAHKKVVGGSVNLSSIKIKTKEIEDESLFDNLELN